MGYKRLVYWMLLISLWLSTSNHSQVLAAEESEKQSGGVITGFSNERVFQNIVRASYMMGEYKDLFYLMEGIEAGLDCTVRFPGEAEAVSGICTGKWDIDPTTLTKGGDYNLTLTIISLDGYSFAEGVRRQIVVPIRLINPNDSTITITSIEEWRYAHVIAVAVPVGSTVEMLSDQYVRRQSELWGADADGVEYQIDIEWDFSSVNLNAPGAYTVNGCVKPIKGTKFSDTLVLPKPYAYVSVQQSGQPDINCFYGQYTFPWVTPPGDMKNITLWISKDNVVWEEAEADKYYDVFESGITIQPSLFEENQKYYIQVKYDGGKTGILEFVYEDLIQIITYYGGDRDGSISQMPPLWEGDEKEETIDGGENNKSNSNTGNTSSTNSGENNTEKIAVLKPVKKEEGSGDTMPLDGEYMSGKHIKQSMHAKGGVVTFSNDGISVSLLAEYLNMLNIQDADVFQIQIERLDNIQFSFRLSHNEKELTDVPGTKVMLPYERKASNSVLSISHEGKEGMESLMSAYDESLSVASFEVNQTGDYKIKEEIPIKKAESSIVQDLAEEEKNVGLGATGVLLFLLIGCVVFYRVKKR